MDAGPATASGHKKCPVCRKTLTMAEHRAVLVRLRKEARKTYGKLIREDRKKFESNLMSMRKIHKESLKRMKRSQIDQDRIFQKRLKEENLKHQKQMHQELARMKRHYQIQAENIREFYGNQGKTDEKKLDLGTIASQYEVLSNKILVRLEALHDILVHEAHMKSSSESTLENTLASTIDSGVADTPEEVQKLERLREIAEIIKRISAEKRKVPDLDNTNAL